MLNKTLMMSALVSTLLLTNGVALATDQERAPQQVQKQEQVYGSQLMTQQERVEYRSKMRSAKTAEERDKIRMDHHEFMKDRAKQRGVTLPDTPPAGGGGRNR